MTTDHLFPLGPEQPLIVPVKRLADLERVGAVAARIADAFDASIDIVSIVCEGDDVVDEFDRFAHAVESFGQRSSRRARLRLFVSETVPETFVAACASSVTCMATGASPFKQGHYVGSFAASLLASCTAPVVLVGPAVAAAPQEYTSVIATISDDPASSHVLPAAREFATMLGLPMARVRVDTEGSTVYTDRYEDPDDRLASSLHAALGVDPVPEEQIDETILGRSSGAILAVATRARQGLAWIAEGSVAFDLVNESDSPVLAVGPKLGGRTESPHTSVGDSLTLSSNDPNDAANELREWIEGHPDRELTEVAFIGRSHPAT